MEIKVINIKCDGCVNTVKKELKDIWIKNIKILFTKNDSIKSRTIKFEWKFELVKKKLINLWYPEIKTKEANSFFKKTKSFISCIKWKKYFINL